jgi:hypothetical protein
MQGAFDQRRAEGILVEVLDGLAGDRVVGLGFRLLDDLVATACHCLPRFHGRLVLPDPDLVDRGAVLARVRRPGTPEIALAEVLAADPCADLALLGGQPDPRRPLQALIALLEPPRLALGPLRDGPVFVYTHERRWVEGYATGTAISTFRPADKLRGATSGAPVFDAGGRVVGLVGHNDVRVPDATLCALCDRLPGWALRRAHRAEATAGAAASPPAP